MEKPYTGKATIQETIRGLYIEIPPKRNWGVIIFFVAWLGGWAFGEIMVISQLINEVFLGSSDFLGTGFMLFWLIGWTVGGLKALKILLFLIAGKEFIQLNGTQLTIGKQGFLIGKSKTYDLQKIKDFSVCDMGNSSQTNWMEQNNSVIQFDYGMKTIRFGDSLSEAEAKHIINQIRTKGKMK